MRSLERGVGSTDGMKGLHRLQQGRSLDGQHAGTHLPRRRRQCARRCLALVNARVSRLWTRSRGSYLPQMQQNSGPLLLARPPTPDWEDNCQRLFESDVERAAQGHAEVRIAATTCHQGNRSMSDVAAAEKGLVRVHGPRDRTSSPPREQCSRQGFVGRTFSE